MKKFLIAIAVLILTGSIAAYVIYKYYMPNVVAEAIVNEKVPDYLPKKVQNKIKALRSPVNAGAEEVVNQIHRANVPLDKVLTMIDNTNENQIDNLIAELQKTPLKNTDQVFDIAKKHVSADFDMEVLRQPFKKHVNLNMVRRGIQYRNDGKSNKLNVETVKEVIKKVLIEKEKELQAK